MTAPLLTIVVPTISERARWLEGCLQSYRATTPPDVQIVVVRDAPTCAVAWNEGIAQAEGQYVHLTADDIEAHPGWWQAAVGCEGYVPAPKILNTDGSLQSCGGASLERDGARTEISRIPFAPIDLMRAIGPFPEDLHYFTDNLFSWGMRKLGVETRVCHAYEFTHHLAPERREMADERLYDDGVKFNRMTRRG